MNQSKRADLIASFQKKNGVNCISAESDCDPEFNPSGCDVCDSLACDTYPMRGFAPKTREVLELGDVCHECLCVAYNGVEDGSNRKAVQS